jgi:hypothetical protein
MDRNRIIEPIGFVIAGCTFLFSWILFYQDTNETIDSFTAAFMAAALVWMSYVILRLMWVTMK